MSHQVRILTFSVAHGNSHAIWTPSGKLVLIDLGASDDFSPVKWLKSQNIKNVDLLILTHPHDDHIRGFRDLSELNVRILHRPKNIPAELTKELDADLQTAWKNYDAHFNTPVQHQDKFYDSSSPAFDGMSLRFFGGVSDSPNLNNFSVVTVLEYAGLKVIFPGDIENAGWTELLKKKDFCEAISGAQILIAPHHGREAGWCADLFDHIAPYLVLVSDGSETETSAVSQYIQKTKGANVKARNGGEIKKRYVVSTRDNGHTNIFMTSTPNGWSFEVDVDRH
jgi:beta-lactamase superfamily II metal-dependent hydrolase